MSSATGSQPRPGDIKSCQIRTDVDLPGLMRAQPDRYPYLLQSAATAPDLARYDILFAFPGERLTLDAKSQLSGPYSDNGAFLAALDAWWQAEQTAVSGALDLPFTGGWFLYLGYELAGEIEPALKLRSHAELPIAFATRIPAAIIVDHQDNVVHLVCEQPHAHLMDEMRADIEAFKLHPLPAAPIPSAQIIEPPAEEFIESVNQAKAEIAAGSVYQANLSRNWQAVLAADSHPVDLYQRLCASNPAPFAGLLIDEEFAVLCSSPERLIRKTGTQIDTRPIAGTRPRTEKDEQSSERKRELLDHPKERAEHIMLIDLERNDLGRVCVGGSIEVSEYMVVESYAHVHHIVSNVTGTARPDLTPGELISAVFPGGTITGCPKVRCMEIIAGLEQRPRGAYTGSMGYLDRNGDCDLNILIRSMVQHGRRIELAAGSGIVADSDPQAELEETRAKAKGLLLALAETTNPDAEEVS